MHCSQAENHLYEFVLLPVGQSKGVRLSLQQIEASCRIDIEDLRNFTADVAGLPAQGDSSGGNEATGRDR